MEKYLDQWYEVAKIGCGKTMDELRKIFAKDITNDEEDYIDLNYKDILVTFNKLVDGTAFISRYFEYYNENGVFCGELKITCDGV